MPDQARILIVDDDPVALDTYGRILEIEGYAVSTAASPERALEELDRIAPHAIVLDLHLPGVTGLELLRQIRQDARRGCPRIALVTADYLLDDGIPQEVEELGARLWFKPLWADDLVRLANDLVSGGLVPERRPASPVRR